MAKGKKTKAWFKDQYDQDFKDPAKDLKQDFSLTKMYINIMVILLLLVLILPNFDYFKNMINSME
jgi:competence protein ComGC